MSAGGEGRRRSIIEPFRIRSVEPIRMTTPDERIRLLEAAGYNVFLLRSQDVLLDFLTDSGTSAMSAAQWAGLQRGDESYAGSPSFFRFEETVQEIFGFPQVIPTHQGRAAERILFSTMCQAGQIVPSNTHFDTTRANVEAVGAIALDLPCAAGRDTQTPHPFKGDMDVEALEATFEREGVEQIPLVMLTVTNNSGGGQPVSMQNVREVAAVCQRYGRPLYIDACRFAENAWFIKEREPGYQNHSVRAIVREMFDLADGCTMSAKKDGLANIGGFLALRDPRLALEQRNMLILTEGFPTYGGLAGRDLEAIAIGLEEVLEEDYLAYRLASVRYLGDRIHAGGVPIMQPPGGHAIYIDAAAFLPQVAPSQFPGQTLVAELYLEGGIRGVEVGSVMFGRHDPATGEETPARMELVRLALPRRVYTQSHVDYAVETILDLAARKDRLGGFRIVEQQPVLRHFTARFAPLYAVGSGIPGGSSA
jgi:tyrosine phenol-lyase